MQILNYELKYVWYASHNSRRLKPDIKTGDSQICTKKISLRNENSSLLSIFINFFLLDRLQSLSVWLADVKMQNHESSFVEWCAFLIDASDFIERTADTVYGSPRGWRIHTQHLYGELFWFFSMYFTSFRTGKRRTRQMTENDDNSFGYVVAPTKTVVDASSRRDSEEKNKKTLHEIDTREIEGRRVLQLANDLRDGHVQSFISLRTAKSSFGGSTTTVDDTHRFLRPSYYSI